MLILRIVALRPFVLHHDAESGETTRIAAGDAIDYDDPRAQAFVRANLGWDAFRVEFARPPAAGAQAKDLAAQLAAAEARVAALDAAAKAAAAAKPDIAALIAGATIDEIRASLPTVDESAATMLHAMAEAALAKRSDPAADPVADPVAPAGAPS